MSVALDEQVPLVSLEQRELVGHREFQAQLVRLAVLVYKGLRVVLDRPEVRELLV